MVKAFCGKADGKSSALLGTLEAEIANHSALVGEKTHAIYEDSH